MATEQWFLQDLRKELGVTQDALAKETDLTQFRVSEFERGVDRPTWQERQTIVDAMVRRAAARGFQILFLDKKG